MNLDHGVWSGDNEDAYPPDYIEPGQTVHWSSESNGIWTGTEGWVNWQVERSPNNWVGLVHMHWTTRSPDLIATMSI
jgi:hypothetical protein